MKNLTRPKRSGRIALLTSFERNYISGRKKLGISNRKKLFSKLERRFDALLVDLDIIAQSDLLKTWKARYCLKHHPLEFEKIFTRAVLLYQPLHLSIVRNIKKNGETRFWLEPFDDMNQEYRNKIKNDRVFDPKYILRKIRRIDENIGATLVEAYQKHKLPHREDYALTIAEIKEHIKTGKNPNEYPVEVLKKIEPDEYKRYKEVEGFLEKGNKTIKEICESLNKKLEDSGSGIRVSCPKFEIE